MFIFCSGRSRAQLPKENKLGPDFQPGLRGREEEEEEEEGWQG